MGRAFREGLMRVESAIYHGGMARPECLLPGVQGAGLPVGVGAGGLFISG